MSTIFWVEVEPKVPLAIVLCPRGDSVLSDEMAELKAGGVETLVSLLEKDEAAWLGLAEERHMAAQTGIKFLSHPIPDANVPLDAAAFRVFVKGLAKHLRAGEHIGVHCRGSIGRATVTAACTLIHLGFAPSNALAAVEAARGCQVPDTLQQARWILQYKAKP